MLPSGGVPDCIMGALILGEGGEDVSGAPGRFQGEPGTVRGLRLGRSRGDGGHVVSCSCICLWCEGL